MLTSTHFGHMTFKKTVLHEISHLSEFKMKKLNILFNIYEMLF